MQCGNSVAQNIMFSFTLEQQHRLQSCAHILRCRGHIDCYYTFGQSTTIEK